MVAAAPNVTPIVVALVLAVVAFAAFLPVVVKDSRRPLPPPRPAKVRPVRARPVKARPVKERRHAPPSPSVPTDVVDDAYVEIPARRAAVALGALGIVALWTTLGARTRRSARR